MPLPEFTKKLIETRLDEYCHRKIPDHAGDKVKLIYTIRGNSVTLIESRQFYCDPLTWTETPVAQFRFDEATKKWELYAMDRNSRWRLYDLVKPSAVFDDMLAGLDADRIGIFWG